MDGTIANFYGVNGWLTDLENENVRPYAIAKPLFDMTALASILNKLQNKGYIINIISWLSKTGSKDFDKAVTKTKKEWLKRYLPNVKFDNIHIVPYGTPKHNISSGILFDDEKNNRDNWGEGAYDVDNILNILQSLE
jgi:5'(3')-deoxyribonucleotidase